jgi:(1->4)-alpha-D-glucan 1-alpha-D-glucosylmutase
LLQLRRDRESLFAEGAYVPLEATGRRRGNVVAFARRSGSSWAVTLVPRLTASIALHPQMLTFGRRAWPATVVRLPARAPARWRNVLTGEDVQAANGRLRVGDAFARFPVAVLVSVRR